MATEYSNYPLTAKGMINDEVIEVHIPQKNTSSITLQVGRIHKIIVDKKGYYKIEAHGGNGGGVNWNRAGSGEVGNSGGAGGAGGLTSIYKKLNKGDIFYAIVGGDGAWTGGNTFDQTISYGGANGGVSGWSDGDEGGGASGGCTYVGTTPYTALEIYNQKLSSEVGKIWCIAGGGGGGYAGIDYGTAGGTGGTGGGSSGGLGKYNYDGSTSPQSYAYSIDTFGVGGSVIRGSGTFGGGNGGGGYVRGSGTSTFKGGNGGSGFVNTGIVGSYLDIKGTRYYNVTANGASTGAKVVISYQKNWVSPTIYWGDDEVDSLYVGDDEVDTVYYGDKEIGS